jgi:hypothetical protein
VGGWFRKDYERPIKPFFIEIPNFWAWAGKFWDNLVGQFQEQFREQFEKYLHKFSFALIHGTIITV